MGVRETVWADFLLLSVLAVELAGRVRERRLPLLFRLLSGPASRRV